MKSSYSKIIKWILLALIVISVAVFVFGWVYGFETNGNVAVDALFIWAYVMLGIALVSIVLVSGVIGVMNDKKYLVKILAVLAGTAALCAIVYFISPGAPAVGIAEQPSDSTLKLTDTILNLTYLCGGVAILSIIVGSVVNAIRNRK
ncbi:MAG: hypothetical protein ACI3Y4_07830 [Candidatus Cryptobacteroides sp.]